MLRKYAFDVNSCLGSKTRTRHACLFAWNDICNALCIRQIVKEVKVRQCAWPFTNA